MKGLKDNVYVVTGGANGIGLAASRALVAYGAKVIVVDIDVEQGTLVTQRMNKEAGTVRAQFFKADIGINDDLKGLANFLKLEYGEIKGLANIASVPVFSTTSESFEHWEKSFRYSVSSYAILSAMLLPIMKRGSSIVNMSSISGKIAQPGFGSYSASKAAVLGLTRCQALDFSSFEVRVNSISPGTILTAKNIFHIKNDFKISENQIDDHPEFGGKHVLKRCGRPEEVGEAISFLLSDSSSFITGSELVVDGGYTII